MPILRHCPLEMATGEYFTSSLRTLFVPGYPTFTVLMWADSTSKRLCNFSVYVYIFSLHLLRKRITTASLQSPV